MSTLIVDELFAGVVASTDMKIYKDMDLAFVRPWVLVQGTLVDGTFTMRVKKGSEVLKTATIDYTEINAGKQDTYAHGYIRFNTHPLMLNIPDGATEETYTFEFEMVGHTTDSTNFLGLVRRWDSDDIYEDPNDIPPNDFVSPYGIELYEFKEL